MQDARVLGNVNIGTQAQLSLTPQRPGDQNAGKAVTSATHPVRRSGAAPPGRHRPCCLNRYASLNGRAPCAFSVHRSGWRSDQPVAPSMLSRLSATLHPSLTPPRYTLPPCARCEDGSRGTRAKTAPSSGQVRRPASDRRLPGRSWPGKTCPPSGRARFVLVAGRIEPPPGTRPSAGAAHPPPRRAAGLRGL